MMRWGPTVLSGGLKMSVDNDAQLFIGIDQIILARSKITSRKVLHEYVVGYIRV